MAKPSGDRGAAVVTGVSSGIGKATALHLLRQGLTVYGSVRRREDADRLRRELPAGFVPLLFDVLDEAAVRAAAKDVQARVQAPLRGLVNSAGIAELGPLLHQPVDAYRQQIEVNLVGPMIVTQAFAPLLMAQKTGQRPGRIVNIGSVGGRMAAPFMGGYVAAKHGLEGFTDVLRRELMLHDIDVIMVAPGGVKTPIWDKAEATVSTYDKTPYGAAFRRFSDFFIKQGRAGFAPEEIASVVWEALTTASPKARYALVHNRLFTYSLPLTLPKRRVDAILARRIGLLDGKSKAS